MSSIDGYQDPAVHLLTHWHVYLTSNLIKDTLMNYDILSLIKTVNEKYNHIQDLEVLGDILEKAELHDECEIARTTHNAHYNYHLFTTNYQDKFKHIDNFVAHNENGYNIPTGILIGVEPLIEPAQ